MYVLPCSVSDDQARSTSFTVGITVLLPLNSTCGATATPINAIQGRGNTIPLAGQVVNIQGTVVGDFQAAGQLNGFYVEEAGSHSGR